jgi:hypothetical protein
MKTALLKIVTVLLLISAGNKTLAATNSTSSAWTTLPWITNFYKIEAHGNVEVHLICGDKNRVEINNTYYDHNALLQVEHGVLRVTCYNRARLQVWITVNDLRSLSAYDNVLVMSEGKFSAIDFDLELNNNAKATMDLDCCCAEITLNDRAKADIKGTTTEGDLSVNYAATLNKSSFMAYQLSSKRIDAAPQIPIQYAVSGGSNPISNSAIDTVELPELELRYQSYLTNNQQP